MPTKGKTLKAPGSMTKQQRDAEYDRRRKADPKLAKAKRIRSSELWRKVRRRVLREQPLCPACEAEGRVVPATQVHHKAGLVDRPDLAFKRDNLVGLCVRHHMAEEAKIRAIG